VEAPAAREAREARALDLLVGASWLLGVPQELGPMVHLLLGALEDVLGAERSAIFLCDREGGLVPRQQRAREDASRRPPLRPEQVAAILRQPAEHPGSPRIGEIGGRTVAAVPLLDNQKQLGALAVESQGAGAWSLRERRVLGMLGQMTGAAIGNARRWREHVELERLRSGLADARLVQHRLLPQSMPSVPGYQLEAFNETCLEVGGDFHDADVTPDGKLHLVVGDVCGKGPGPALVMAEILGALRVLRGLDLDLERVARAIDGHLLRWTAEAEYATMFLATLDPQSHRLAYVSAGHPPACLIHPDGTLEQLFANGPPAGLLPNHEVPFELATVEMSPGSMLVLYTDGVTEAQPSLRADGRASDPDSWAGEEFGDAVFRVVLLGCGGLDAGATVEAVCKALHGYRGDGPRADDVTLLVLKRA
jgi:serine phosphatase RsbU (regulator of sigma subunit)